MGELPDELIECLYCFSEVLGWVPMWGEFPDELIEDYLEAYGLLVEDLEVMYGAYREDNQNCKLLSRLYGPRSKKTFGGFVTM